MSQNNQGLSRRNLLKAAGVGSVGLGLFAANVQPAAAQTQASDIELLASYQFNLGDFEAFVISDSNFSIQADFYQGASQEEVLEFFPSLGITEDGTLDNIAQILVLNTGADVVVFDTGFGQGAPQGGRLVPTLEALGIGTGDVTTVIISHFHPDHISGMTRDGNAVFANATYYFPQPEKDFMDAQGADSPAAGTVAATNAQLEPLMANDQVVFYSDGDDIVPGVTAVAAHGHTPGHMAFMIESNGEQLMNLVDTMINVYPGMMRPNWSIQFDSLPEMAVETRKTLLTQASDNRTLLFGYHFPFPGLGYASDNGDESWLWVPAAF